MPVFQEEDKWIAECEKCDWRDEKDSENSAKMALVRHAALCPGRKKKEKKAAEAPVEEEIPQTFSELVEQVMTDYGIKPEVIERVKRRVAHTNKYERDPVQFRRLLEGQRLKQSTVQMIVEDVFDEYVGARVPGSARYTGYERYMRQPYDYQPYTPYEAYAPYVAPYPVPTPVRERIIERPLPSGGVERVIYVGPGERGRDYSSLERRFDRIERTLEDLKNNGPRLGGEVIVNEPLRDEAGNIVRDKDGRPLYRTLRGPASLMAGAGGLLVMPRAEPERVPREVNDRLNRIERVLEDLRKNSEGSSIVTITEPIRDEEGRLITDENGKPIYKIVKGPANVVGGVSDFRDRLLEKLALERFEGRSSGESPNVVIREPLRDADGRIVTGEDGKPLYRIIQGPPSVVGAVGTDFRDRLLEKVVLEQTKPKSELTTEKIRNIIRDEMKARETPRSMVSKDDLERYKKDTVESVKKLLEERETEDRLARIEKDLKDIKTGAAGHMSEEGRIKLTTISKGIDAIEKQIENINTTITNLVNTIPKLLKKEAPEGTRVPVSETEIEQAAEKLEEKVGEVVEHAETVA